MDFGDVCARAKPYSVILQAFSRLLPNVDVDAIAADQAESGRIGIVINISIRDK
jgi:hypothetical protein